MRFGYHQALMARIQMWLEGILGVEEFSEEYFKITSQSNKLLAEKLLETEGVAWRSSVGKPVVYANKLNFAERCYLRGVGYV